MTDSLRKVSLFEPDLRLGIMGVQNITRCEKKMADFRFVCN